jgi:predicted Zn-dependent protease
MWERVRAVRPWVRVAVAGGVLALVVGGVFVGLVVARKADERQRAQAAATEWKKFDAAARAGDEQGMLTSLDAVAGLTADPQCDRYRAAVTSGDAPADDPRLCLLTTTLHARCGRRADAAREARKRLVHEPADWMSRCLVALAAVTAGDPAVARAELDLLPDPAAAGPTPAGLLLAFELFRRTGRDPAPLRKFVNDVVVDVLNSVAVDDDPPAVKAEMIECYLLGFGGPPDEPLPVRLGGAFAAVVRLADEVARSDDPAVLAKLGAACNRLPAATDRLLRANQMTAAQRDGLAKEHEARTVRVWRRVQQLAPTTAAAYHGLALAEVRAKRLPEAVELVRAGLKECGNDPPLLALFAVLLRATGRTDEALRTLGAAADADPTNVNLLLLTAETAFEVPRLDVAAVALRFATAVAPSDPRVVRLDVRLKLLGGDTHGAVQRLRDLGEPAVLAEPPLAHVYTRTLSDAGLGVLLPDWIEKVEKRAGGTSRPGLLAAAVRGLTDSRFDSALWASALKALDRTLARWPGDADLLTARAALLARWAECDRPRWEPARTREAASALERVRAITPDDADTAAALARVRLHGLKDAQAALKDVAPLLAQNSRGALVSADHLAVVGAVLLANKQADAAVRALETARTLGPPSAAVCICLALAYHTRGDTARGRPLATEASRLPRTPQDDADLNALPATLRETP